MALAAAHARNDAEGAVVVAPLDDADIVADAGAARPRQCLAQGVVVARLELRDETVVLADRHDCVNLRKAPSEVVALLADDAACDGDRAVGRLPRSQLVKLRVA